VRECALEQYRPMSRAGYRSYGATPTRFHVTRGCVIYFETPSTTPVERSKRDNFDIATDWKRRGGIPLQRSVAPPVAASGEGFEDFSSSLSLPGELTQPLNHTASFSEKKTVLRIPRPQQALSKQYNRQNRRHDDGDIVAGQAAAAPFSAGKIYREPISVNLKT